MTISDESKYTISFLKQRLEREKRAMFISKPGSIEHRQAVITYDRNRMELKHSEGALKKFFGTRS